MPSSANLFPRKFAGLLVHRPRWSLSGRGKIALGIVIMLIVLGWLLGIYPFLAPTQKLEAQMLVVEGWVPHYGMKSAITEFKSGGYQRLFTTGGPVTGMGGYTNDYNTSAGIGAGLLKTLGMDATHLQMVPSRVFSRDRTYASAVALHEWFRVHHPAERSINVMTTDVHARRTQLLFQKAFGQDVQVGIISVPNPDYDATRWWRYSEGVRDVLGETIAYLYAKFFFYP